MWELLCLGRLAASGGGSGMRLARIWMISSSDSLQILAFQPRSSRYCARLQREAALHAGGTDCRAQHAMACWLCVCRAPSCMSAKAIWPRCCLALELGTGAARPPLCLHQHAGQHRVQGSEVRVQPASQALA